MPPHPPPPEGASDLVSRFAETSNNGGANISGYQYYLICAVMSIMVGGLIFWKSRGASRRNANANDGATQQPQRPDIVNQQRPIFYDAYVGGVREKYESGLEWESMMPLTVSPLQPYDLQSEEGEPPPVPDRAQVAILLHMPGHDIDMPYLELGTLQVDVVQSSRPTSSLFYNPAHLQRKGRSGCPIDTWTVGDVTVPRVKDCIQSEHPPNLRRPALSDFGNSAAVRPKIPPPLFHRPVRTHFLPCGQDPSRGSLLLPFTTAIHRQYISVLIPAHPCRRRNLDTTGAFARDGHVALLLALPQHLCLVSRPSIGTYQVHAYPNTFRLSSIGHPWQWHSGAKSLPASRILCSPARTLLHPPVLSCIRARLGKLPFWALGVVWHRPGRAWVRDRKSSCRRPRAPDDASAERNPDPRRRGWLYRTWQLGATYLFSPPTIVALATTTINHTGRLTLADLTDADIMTRCFGPERQTLPDADHQDADHIAIVTKDTISKYEYDGDIEGAYPLEAFALEVLAQHTTIPVPRLHRVVPMGYGHIIVMDRIPGKQLTTVWPTMSMEEKDCIAETLAGYVRQLRSVKIPHLRVPGPVDRDLCPRVCMQGPVFGFISPPQGPFASYAELTELLERQRKGLMDPSIPPMDDSYPLVLTHHDIRPHSLILDDAGTLWMVDWQGAGVYPEWWEGLAMESQTWDCDESWAAIVPRICGEYSERQQVWMKAMNRWFY
ncbi:hypothetical protein FB45DRAFT_1002511 [Roridomyces roridus]|uniref:Aminoglycoside phosphotransferase domain-containing protein n=1 Tax=Roridomyces roridus TaxID=1738132 RepID=A0AAD7FP03_9AGAR|nr:hypothetical protein FB45DRAFT_1002511 [Roridomyces roridus]